MAEKRLQGIRDPRLAPSLKTAFDLSMSRHPTDFAAMAQVLSGWVAVNYRRRWGSQRVIDDFDFGPFTYLFDSSLDGRTDPDAPDTRLLAAWGRADPTAGFGDRRTLRRFPLPPGAGRDRGHLIAMSAGAGDYVNLVPQDSALNRGHSSEGKRWRQLEESIVRDPGAFVFVAVHYDDVTDIPTAFDYLVVHTNGSRRFESFAN